VRTGGIASCTFDRDLVLCASTFDGALVLCACTFDPGLVPSPHAMTHTSTAGERAKARGARLPAPSPVEGLRRAPRQRSSPWLRRALVFAICAILLDALFGDRGLAETRRARAEYADASAALQRLKAENAGLREQIRRLEHDPATMEALARKELGFIRPGEILVVVRDVKQPGPVSR
jgi:cell division protein FtsB